MLQRRTTVADPAEGEEESARAREREGAECKNVFIARGSYGGSYRRVITLTATIKSRWQPREAPTAPRRLVRARYRSATASHRSSPSRRVHVCVQVEPAGSQQHRWCLFPQISLQISRFVATIVASRARCGALIARKDYSSRPPPPSWRFNLVGDALIASRCWFSVIKMPRRMEDRAIARRKNADRWDR